jgi:putative tryptophan/tyrosine transport system substrate-binding protein
MTLRRREFITLLGGASAWPLAARAQPQERTRRIGIFLGGAQSELVEAWIRAFQQEFDRLGWSEGRNIAFIQRWGEARPERSAEIAAELVRLGVDAIVAGGTPPTIATMRATATIPIVFVGAGDPLGTGLVASLAKPGGNVTGLSNQNRDVAGKRLALLRELVPDLRRLGILGNPDNPSEMLEARDVAAWAAAAGLDATALEIRQMRDIDSALDGLKGPGLGLYVTAGPLTNANALRINTLALVARLPTMYGSREPLDAGGLMSYGANSPAMYRRAAQYVDKILRGAKPGDLPVEQPTQFDLVINLITAKALGIEVPLFLQQRADAVIE